MSNNRPAGSPAPKNGGKAIKGKAYTTSSGEKRIRIADIQNARSKSEDTYECTLGDILLGSAAIDNEDPNKVIRVKPINLKGLAALTAMYGNDLRALSGAATDFHQTIRIVTILVNQDRPEAEHLTEDEVGRTLDMSIAPLVNELVTDLISPLFAPVEVNS